MKLFFSFSYQKYDFIRANLIYPINLFVEWMDDDDDAYRMAIGTAEALLGFLLMVLQGNAKNIARILLIAIMSFTMYIHMRLEDDFVRMIPFTLFGFILVCQMCIIAISPSSESDKENQVITDTVDENSDLESLAASPKLKKPKDRKFKKSKK